jgi:hypothetical protein
VVVAAQAVHFVGHGLVQPLPVPGAGQAVGAGLAVQRGQRLLQLPVGLAQALQRLQHALHRLLARGGQQHGADHDQRAVRAGHRELQALAAHRGSFDAQRQLAAHAGGAGGDVLVALAQDCRHRGREQLVIGATGHVAGLLPGEVLQDGVGQPVAAVQALEADAGARGLRHHHRQQPGGQVDVLAGDGVGQFVLVHVEAPQTVGLGRGRGCRRPV